MNNKVKGYKVFNSDWTCRGFQYKVGETYKHDGDIELCGSGFHFCIEPADCFNYYTFDSNNKVAEVEAIGIVETGDDKSVTNEIKVVRELDWLEVLKLVNTGKECTGYGNSGDYNIGNYNTGDRNRGDRNTGDNNSGWSNTGNCNTGYRNTGDNNSGWSNTGYRNIGDYNIGNYNSGNWNSGNYNSGNWNSGDWNLGNGNNGVFCIEEPKIKIFDVQSDMTLSEWRKTEASQILRLKFRQNVWIHSGNMTDEEKEQYPSYEVTGGYLKTLSFKEACNNMWNNLNDKEKEVIKNIPNFNAKKFKEITGIEV